jgi:hypothetical protein
MTDDDKEIVPGGGSRAHLSEYSPDGPASPPRLLFIHHSVGGQLLADCGPEQGNGSRCIFHTHPNGGGLRSQLERHGYVVHESSYGSRIGDRTDLFDWVEKFRREIDLMLQVDCNDKLYSDGRRNQVIVFKSCYPNSSFVGDGEPPGNPFGPELTVANAKASMRAVLEEIRRRPDVLFVYMTAPPLAPVSANDPAWKAWAKKLLGQRSWNEAYAAKAALARRFNNWMTATDGWLKDYPFKNVVVFNYYDVLTGYGESDLSRFPTGDDGLDSHPSAAGNARAAADFVPFLNRAVRRAGLSE